MARQTIRTDIEVDAKGATAELKKLGGAADSAAVDVDQLADKLKQTGKASKDAGSDVRRGSDDIESSGHRIGKVYDETGDSALGAASAIGEAFGEGGSAASAMGSMGEVVESFAGMFGPLGIAVSAVGGVLIGAFSQAAAHAEELKQKTKDYFDAFVEGAGQLDKAVKEENWRKFVQDNQRLAETVKDLLGPQGLNDLADAVGGNTAKIGEMSGALERNKRILEAERDALYVTRVENGALTDAQAKRLGAIEDQISGIDRLKGKLSDEGGAVRTATDQWNLYRGGIERAAGAKASFSAAVPARAPVKLDANGQVPGDPRKRAAGGPVSAGTPYMVGEYGREMFVPNVSGTIVPNGGGVGGSVTINQTILTNDPMRAAQQTAQALRRADWRLGR